MVDGKGKAAVGIHAKTGTDSSEAASESSSAAMAPSTPSAGEAALATSASDSKLPEVLGLSFSPLLRVLAIAGLMRCRENLFCYAAL